MKQIIDSKVYDTDAVDSDPHVWPAPQVLPSA